MDTSAGRDCGKVRLLRIDEYPQDWDPAKDKRLPIWETCHQLRCALKISETEAGALLARMINKSEPIRQLAYRPQHPMRKQGLGRGCAYLHRTGVGPATAAQQRIAFGDGYI